MKKRHISAILLAGVMTASVLTGCGNQAAGTGQEAAAGTEQEAADAGQSTPENEPQDVLADEEETLPETENNENILMIAKQGMFSSGGTVTEPVEGEYDPTTNWMDTSRAGNTAHVDHANVFYQIPANDNGNPMVYLHGYGQSRMGWMTTPDGREGWSDLFLKKGYAAFLVDQPRRGEAGATASMTTEDFLIHGRRIPKTINRETRHGIPISESGVWHRNGMRVPSSRKGMKHRTSFSAR